MNHKLRRSLAGVCFGLIVSVVFSFVITPFVNLLAGGISFGGLLWFWAISFVPLSFTFGMAGYVFSPGKQGKFQYWTLCAFIGFMNVLYMGTVGAIMGSAGQLGIEHVNVQGYLAWGPVYAAATLPLSTPVTAVLMSLFRYFIDNRIEKGMRGS
ncbi:hypothetical protein LJK88_46670 [Paenibacillus sp. P26]|nr:hypothetical protein LJK88_46670 [Paenibacillus sp. P26]UUZ91930.1 hypothetical protein LJK87_41640 [Paenibacillus sp. P25]